MILAFSLSDLVTVPFGWLLGQLYHLTNNYGVAMIIFALVVQGIMVPMRAKAKKSTMKISRLQPRIQQIQTRYANDPQKQNEVMQKLYQEEGVSMGGSCLWSLIPLFILFPLFTVIREPITYILGESVEVTAQIIETIKGLNPDLFNNARGNFYDQVILPVLSASTLTSCRLQSPVSAPLPWRVSTSTSWVSTWAAFPTGRSGPGML